MGLLDALSFDGLQGDQQRFGLALLAAAAPRAGGANFGAGLLGALQSVEQGKSQRAQEALKMKLLEAQIGETQAQGAQRQAEAQKMAQAQARMQAFQQSLGGAVSPAQAASAPGGPTQANAQAIGQRQAPDWAALAQRFPDQIDLIKKLSESQDFGRAEVARTMNGMVNGREVAQQFDKFGRPVGQGLEQWKAPIQMDTGGGISLRDAYNPTQEIAGIKKTNSPDALLSADTARRGQNMNDARSREANGISMMNGKIPPGYRMKQDGTLEAIPGGPADIKAGELGAKDTARKTAAVVSAGNVLEAVQDAKGMVSNTTAGFGALSAGVPMTPARDLSAKLETIKANLGFDRLQEMRQNSPTGGALGAVAVQELTALQSTVASLDQKQSPAQLAQSLAKIEKHYGNWIKIMGGVPPPTTTSVDDLLKKYGGK